MAIIQFILALVILGKLYIRMIRREEPEQISRIQGVLPVIFGTVSVPISFIMFLAIGNLMLKTGISFNHLPAAVRSVMKALFFAGLPEEITKLLFMLLAILLFRARIRNVYEYVLIGAGVGMGFSLLEEFFYGAGGMMVIIRIIIVAAHMIFGMIMAGYLGMASYRKANGKAGAAREYFLALAIPLIIHTLFDACTATNTMMNSSDDTLQMIGLVIAFAAMVVLFVLQIIIFKEFKKKTAKYCSLMTVSPHDDPA